MIPPTIKIESRKQNILCNGVELVRDPCTGTFTGAKACILFPEYQSTVRCAVDLE